MRRRITASIALGIIGFLGFGVLSLIARLLGDAFVPAILTGLLIGAVVFVVDLMTSIEGGAE